MTGCPTCGGPRVAGARFCGSCGTPALATAGARAASRYPAPAGWAAPDTRTWPDDVHERPSTSWEDGVATGAARGGRVLAAATLAVLLALGGSAAWAATQGREAPLVTTPQSVAAAPPASSGLPQGSVPVAPSTAPDTENDTENSTTVGTALPADTALVTVAGSAASDPDATEVRTLLEQHFAAINARDYDGWLSTVTARRGADETRSHWLDGFRTTGDSDVVVSAVSPTGSSTALASVSFVSTQAPADAPDGTSGRLCWTQQLPISGLGSDPRIGVPAKGSTRWQPC